MKKLTAIVLALVMLLAFAACSNNGTEEETTTDETTAAVTETGTEDTDTTRENLFDNEPVTNEDGDVVITCPPSFYDEDNPPSEELTDEQKEQGFKQAIANEDGSLSYIISADKYESVKTQNIEDITSSLAQYSETTEYINKVGASEDFSVINIQVDEEGFNSDLSALAYVWEIGLYGELAQVFAGVAPDKLSVDVIITDAETGDVINAAHYPEK